MANADMPCDHVIMVWGQVPTRARDIAVLRGLGYTLREIACLLGVTPQAISLTLSRHRRSMDSWARAAELQNLPARAVKALALHGIRTREEARRSDVLAHLHGQRNCGQKTLNEIRCWIDGTVPGQAGEGRTGRDCSKTALRRVGEPGAMHGNHPVAA